METRCVGCETEKAVVFIPEHCVQFQHLLASVPILGLYSLPQSTSTIFQQF